MAGLTGNRLSTHINGNTSGSALRDGLTPVDSTPVHHANGNDIAAVDRSASDVASIVYDAGNPAAGTVTFIDQTTLAFSRTETTISCFTPGTRIATPSGEHTVENLQIGDRVHTRDNGIQTIVWAGQKTVSRASLAVAPELRPVQIRAGALGNGLPEQDMLVSPNHRMLIVSELAELYFEQSEVLVAAKHLTTRAGIDVVNVPGITYVHFMFANHELVLADGAWSESFQPSDHTLEGVGEAQRQEIFALFPELATEAGIRNYSSARRFLRRDEAALLL